MLAYTFRRLLITIPTLLVVIGVVYILLFSAPGGPFDSERVVPEAIQAQLMSKYHLDLPYWKQYLLYIGQLLQGDLGVSYRYADWSVNELVGSALPVSLTIGGLSIILSLLIGVLLGALAALYRNSFVDYLVMALGSLGSVVPSFVLGPLLVLAFAIGLQWLPSGGWDHFSWQFMVLPVSLLTLINVSTLARIMRASMVEVMGSNYIRTARAKGLPMHLIVFRHALRPSLLPVVTIVGPLAVSSITAALVTESIFSIPGLGILVVNGAANRDYTLVLGLVVLITTLVVLVNLCVDLIYAFLDPRSRA
ncbi:ABC transporter permease subunit [Limnohabitans radicicola]|uniref:ABC transporter permease subunit n=1 Tax=Limnohabitans radicicola TaxID=2771427 RepID=A0A927FHN6_9BURK|nr:ABC transporter permease subunit [Limnohabitans radicicola]MBD8051166.1 ABC transporter permease subunit [Limnohabitans radicicola]